MHYAILNADKLSETRSLRELLTRGADRNVRNNEGKRPIDMVEQINCDPELASELRVLLKQPWRNCSGFLGLFCIRSGAMKQEKSRAMMCIYISFMIFSFTSLCLFNWPYIPEPEIVIAAMIFFVIQFIFYAMASIAGPGYLEKNENVKFLSLVEKIEHNMICPQCEIFCPPESKHCFIC